MKFSNFSTFARLRGFPGMYYYASHHDFLSLAATGHDTAIDVDDRTGDPCSPLGEQEVDYVSDIGR